MKRLMLIPMMLVCTSLPVYAQNNISVEQDRVIQDEQGQADTVQEQIAYLQKEWARIKYHIPEKETKLEAIHMLEDHAEKVTAFYPNRPEPKIWEGIILSTDAGIVKGLSALGKVKKARKLFEAAIRLDETALDGSAHTSLGSLYYQVPGWPIGFGDDEAAEKHIRKALEINPNGIDANFFYADFLLKKGDVVKAQEYFLRALAAPERPNRPLADAGRRQEIKAKLAEIDEKFKNRKKANYN